MKEEREATAAKEAAQARFEEQMRVFQEQNERALQAIRKKGELDVARMKEEREAAAKLQEQALEEVRRETETRLATARMEASKNMEDSNRRFELARQEQQREAAAHERTMRAMDERQAGVQAEHALKMQEMELKLAESELRRRESESALARAMEQNRIEMCSAPHDPAMPCKMMLKT